MTVFMRELETNNVIKYRNIDRVITNHFADYTIWTLTKGEAVETFCSHNYDFVESSDLSIYDLGGRDND